MSIETLNFIRESIRKELLCLAIVGLRDNQKKLFISEYTYNLFCKHFHSKKLKTFVLKDVRVVVAKKQIKPYNIRVFK